MRHLYTSDRNRNLKDASAEWKVKDFFILSEGFKKSIMEYCESC
jgi:hypothetical protein